MKATTALLLALLLLGVDAAAQPPPKREFRGVWLTTVGNGDWPSSPFLGADTQKQQLIAYLNQLRNLNINTVFLQVRPECDAFYESPFEPWSYWLTGVQGGGPIPYYDPLAFAVEEAHKRGMELHAWFNPYRVARSGSNYPKASNHVSNTHPEWVMTISTTKILDPGKSAVREYVLDVIADVVTRYDIDGLVMDDYFYVEGITTQDATTFAEESRGFTSLGDWRRDNVNLLIRGIHDTVGVLKPWVKFGMSPRGIWRNGVPPGIIGADNYNTIFCDAVAWLQGAYIDYFSPQLYWRFGGSQDYALLEPWWATQVNGRIYCPSLAAYRIGETNYGGSGEVAHQIRFNRNSGNTHGYVPFTTHNLTENLGGIGDTLRLDLNRYPALAPSYPWKDTTPPYPPRGIRYEALAGGGGAAIQWELPNIAPDGDSASWYAVYRFDHTPSINELDNPANLISVEGRRWVVPPAPPTTGVPYYYVVTALDRNHNESDTSSVLRVAPPAAPVLALPPDGTTSQPESVTVVWRRVPQAYTYHLQVSTDPTFASGLVMDASGLFDTTAVVRNLVGQATHSWRVRAQNAAGPGGYSTAFTFSTAFPPTPTPVYPGQGEVNVPLSVTFRWNPESTADTYRLQLATSNLFTDPLIDSSGIADTTMSYGTLVINKIYYWRVRATNAIGTSGWSAAIGFRTPRSVDVTLGDEVPASFSLSQNYPNPFNPTTSIRFSIPQAERVTLKVYDLLGREETTLVDDFLPAGTFTVTWNASSSSSGVYFFRMTAGSFIETRRMVLVR